MSTRCNRWFLLQILLPVQHVSGTIMPIIRSSRLLYKWLLPVVFGVWFSSCRYGVELRVVCPVCGLLLLMMGIKVPERCWASNKICNKSHLLHLVGILFPYINDVFCYSKQATNQALAFRIVIFQKLIFAQPVKHLNFQPSHSTPVRQKNPVTWIVTQRALAKLHRHFKETYRLQLQERRGGMFYIRIFQNTWNSTYLMTE